MAECKAQVHQFPIALYKGYSNIEEAIENLHNYIEDDGHTEDAFTPVYCSHQEAPVGYDDHLPSLIRLVFILILISCIPLAIIVYLVRSL